MVEFAAAGIEIAPLFAVVRLGPGIEQMTDVGHMLRHRPASPPTMLRMVPPPRSGEGWRLARALRKTLRFRFARTRGPGCIPPRNGEGGPREARWVGMQAEEIVTSRETPALSLTCVSGGI